MRQYKSITSSSDPPRASDRPLTVTTIASTSKGWCSGGSEMENFFGCGAKRNDDCFAVLCGDAGAQPINDMNQPANNKGAPNNGNQAPGRAEGEAFMVRVIQDWSIDVHEGELIVVIRKGSHGWFFGRVLHDAKGWPTEFGNQGWFPPSFTREVSVSENQTKIGAEILQNSRAGRKTTSFPGK